MNKLIKITIVFLSLLVLLFVLAKKFQNAKVMYWERNTTSIEESKKGGFYLSEYKLDSVEYIFDNGCEILMKGLNESIIWKEKEFSIAPKYIFFQPAQETGSETLIILSSIFSGMSNYWEYSVSNIVSDNQILSDGFCDIRNGIIINVNQSYSEKIYLEIFDKKELKAKFLLKEKK